MISASGGLTTPSRSSPANLTLLGLLPGLSTLRSFPSRTDLYTPLKFCYIHPPYRGARYLVRATYFYGGIDNGSTPPVFDQIVDGTFWTTVNTTADYAAGMASCCEGLFLAVGRHMRVCVAANTYTASDPFALEMIVLEDSVCNGTDFRKYAMGLILEEQLRIRWFYYKISRLQI